MLKIIFALFFTLLTTNVNADYYGCLGMLYTGEELADMDDQQLKKTFCRIGNLRHMTEVRGIGVSYDYYKCQLAQSKIKELLRIVDVKCEGAKKTL